MVDGGTSWWRHQMETFSALLAICAGNSPVPPHKGQWRGDLMFSLICARINDWVNNPEAGDLRRRLANYDVTVMCCFLMVPESSQDQFPSTHWGRVRHICVDSLTIVGSDNGLSPGRRQAIIWTNAERLLFGPLGTNPSEIWINVQAWTKVLGHFSQTHILPSYVVPKPIIICQDILQQLWCSCFEYHRHMPLRHASVHTFVTSRMLYRKSSLAAMRIEILWQATETTAY